MSDRLTGNTTTDMLADQAEIKRLDGKLDDVESDIICAIGNLGLNDSEQQRANALDHLRNALTRIQDEKPECPICDGEGVVGKGTILESDCSTCQPTPQDDKQEATARLMGLSGDPPEPVDWEGLRKRKYEAGAFEHTLADAILAFKKGQEKESLTRQDQTNEFRNAIAALKREIEGFRLTKTLFHEHINWHVSTSDPAIADLSKRITDNAVRIESLDNLRFDEIAALRKRVAKRDETITEIRNRVTELEKHFDNGILLTNLAKPTPQDESIVFPRPYDSRENPTPPEHGKKERRKGDRRIDRWEEE